MKPCPVGTKIQTMIFDRELWTPTEAREWLHAHKMKALKKESSGMILSYRFGQAPLNSFDKKSFRSIEIDAKNGIKAIIGCPRRAINPCSPIKNPCGTKKNPAAKARRGRAATSAISAKSRGAAPRLPAVLVYLGRAVELHNDKWGYRWPRSENMGLYTCPQGKCLYVIANNKKPVSKDQFQNALNAKRAQVDAALKTYSDFHDRDSMTGSIMAAPQRPLVTIGRAHALVYVSNKWTGRDQEYVHDFKRPPLVRADAPNAPRLITIAGAGLRVKKAGITG